MSLTSNDIYRCDDLELQPSRLTLLRAGQKVALAPKTFEVFFCLVQSAGRVVLKQELLETVWRGSFVEESNLTQHVFWLRKALADKASLVVTIPGRGYEFVGRVEHISATQPEAAPVVSMTATVEQTHVFVEETVTRTVTPALWWPRAWLPLTAAALLLAGLGLWGVHRWRARPVPGDHHEVVLADFDNATGDPDFDRTLKTLLAIDLTQSPFLAVAGESDTRKVMKQMSRPPDEPLTAAVAREVCERLNDQVVLSGNVARIGQKYLVTLSATDCSDGRLLVHTKATADNREAVLKAVDTTAAAMRAKLGEPMQALGKSARVELLPAHTFSLEALKAYSQARTLHQKLKFADAVPLYKKAIQLDPNFTDAWAQLGNCYNNMGEALEGRKAMARAYELRDQADEPDRLRITAMYEYWKTGDRHQAIRNYQNWARLYPLTTNPWVMLGEFQASVGRMDLAVEAARHAVANSPNSVSAAQDLAQWLRFDGQLDQAKTVSQQALARGLDSVSLHRVLLEVAWLQHDTAAFDAQRKWYAEKAEEDDRESLQADLDASEGKIKSAVGHWEHLADAQSKNGLKEAALEVFAGVPELEADLGLIPQARKHLERFHNEVALTGPSLNSVIMGAAEAGDGDLAQKKLKFMVDNGKEDSDVLEIFEPESAAAIALAANQPGEALKALEPTRPYELTDSSVPTLRGAAYLAARIAEPAEQEFRNIISRPYTSAISPNVPLAHLQMARALTLEGNRDAARQEYETFFTLWKDADPDLPILKKAHTEYTALTH